MKSITTSDQHWHNFKEFDRLTNEGKSYRLSLYEKSHEFIRQYCLDNNIKIWFDAGDIFHSRESISLPVLDALGRQLQLTKDAGIKLVFVMGNHDTHNKSGNITSLNILSEYGQIVTKKEIISFEKCSILCIPWNETTSFVNEVNSLSDFGNVNLILSHRMLKGAKSNNIILDGESLEGLDDSRFDCALIGHVHEYQKIQDKVYYIGSLISNNFNDKNQDKGFLVYDFELKKFERITNPHSPKYVPIKISTQKEFDDIKQEMKSSPEKFFDIRYEVQDGQETPNFEGADNIRISITKQSNSEMRLKDANLLTPEILLKQYQEIADIPDDIFEIGQKILLECMS